MEVRLDEKKVEEKLKEYDWKVLFKATKEVQYGLCLLTAYHFGCGNPVAAAKSAAIILHLTEVFDDVRALMAELVSPEDEKEVERELKERGRDVGEFLR